MTIMYSTDVQCDRSIMYSADVQCDRCGAWVEGATGQHKLVTKARENAKANGWSYSPRVDQYRDLCPDCLKIFQMGEE